MLRFFPRSFFSYLYNIRTRYSSTISVFLSYFNFFVEKFILAPRFILHDNSDKKLVCPNSFFVCMERLRLIFYYFFFSLYIY